MTTGDWYRLFGEVETAGSSPIYSELSGAIAADERLIQLIDTLPEAKRQPNLLFAACLLLGAPLGQPAETTEFIHSRWDDLSEVMRSRSTQTNEPARAGMFLPLLGLIDGPIALIEVGASAGLCLYPDRYLIRYDGDPGIGPADSPVRIDVATHGPVPIPSCMPEIVMRAGVDLNPLDVRDPDDLAWLQACIWPEHHERRDRLTAAARVVAADPPPILQGDLVARIDDLLDAVPAGAVPVVVHTAVLCYLSPQQRAAFAERVRARPSVVWISNEERGVIDGLTTDLTPPPGSGSKALFVLGRGGGETVAITHPHGAWLRWSDH